LPAAWFAPAYVAKAGMVTASLWFCRQSLRDIRFDAKVIAPSIAVGAIVFVIWVWGEKLVPYPWLGERTAFDPATLKDSTWQAIFVIVRLFGLVLMVPVMEEVFWRSFLLRYLTQSDFQKLPVGTFSASALWLMVAASALAHPP
jgi:CAAX prenyl protease-like protein